MNSQDNVQSKNLNASEELKNLIEQWANTYMKSSELVNKILEKAKEEDVSTLILRDLIEYALRKRGLSESRIRRLVPPELRDTNKIRLAAKNFTNEDKKDLGVVTDIGRKNIDIVEKTMTGDGTAEEPQNNNLPFTMNVNEPPELDSFEIHEKDRDPGDKFSAANSNYLLAEKDRKIAELESLLGEKEMDGNTSVKVIQEQQSKIAELEYKLEDIIMGREQPQQEQQRWFHITKPQRGSLMQRTIIMAFNQEEGLHFAANAETGEVTNVFNAREYAKKEQQKK